ncbi:zinc finger protein 318-like isoform 2-T8 [Vipera latastei]
MYRPGSSPPATRIQRSWLGPIDSSRGFGSRSRSPSPWGRHHRSPPSRRSSHRSHRSPSPRRFSRTYSLDQPSYSPRQRSCSPAQRSESSVEKYLRALIENGRSSPADNLSNVNRDDSSDGPIFSRALSHPWNFERGFFHEENSSRPFSMGHDKDYYNRDIFRAQLDRSINSELLQDQSRENNRGGGQESKYFQYDRKDRLFDESIKSQALLAETEKYRKQSLNRSPSLMYVDEDFHKLERIRRKREDFQRRNISTDYPIPDSANQEQSSESRHHYRYEKTPAVPLKSILKKRSDDSSTQDSGNFSKEKKPPESTLESVNQHGDFLLPHEKASQVGSGFSVIDSTYPPDKRLDPFPDNIEDEEKFLYGDDDGDSNNCLHSQKLTLSEKKEPVREKVNSPPPSSLSVKPETLEQSSPEYDKIRDLLKTIGLDIGVAEIGKLAARTEERLYGKKTTCSPHHHTVANHKAELWKRQKPSLSPFDSFPSAKPVYNNTAKLGQNNPTGICKQSGVPGFLIPSAPPSFLDIPPGPPSGSCQNVPYVSTFTPNRFFPNCASLPVVLPNYDVYQRHMGYATPGWCAQQVNSVHPNKPEVAKLAKLKGKCTNPNLRIINTIAIGKKPSQAASTMVHSQTKSKKKAKRRKCDEKNQTTPMEKVINEREALTSAKLSQQKKLFYQRIELDRLSKQQVMMLLKKREKEDPLLVELSRLKENIETEVAQLEMNIKAIKEKQDELNKVADILETDASEKSQKLSSENEDSSENNLQNNPQSEEKTFDSIKS